MSTGCVDIRDICDTHGVDSHKCGWIIVGSQDWLPGSHAEDYVMSAEMKAVKPLEGGVKSTTTGCCA